MSRVVKIGSRDSVLAIRQAEIVMNTLPSMKFQLVKIKTTGDKILDRSLDKIGGKGLFTKELEQALLSGDIDIAVHSYKDMPHSKTDGLSVVALSERESPFDVLVLPVDVTEIDNSRPVGSSSLRRTIQFQKLYDDCEVKGIRGNVPTRIAKLDSGEYSALILAEAGLNRLSLQSRISRIFTPDEIVPPASQGIIAVQGRQGEDYSYLDDFHNRESEIVSRAERQFLKTLDGGCSAPVGIYGQLRGNEILLTGMFADLSGHMEIGKISGDIGSDFSGAERLGESLANELKSRF